MITVDIFSKIIIDLFGNSKGGILEVWKQHTKKP